MNDPPGGIFDIAEESYKCEFCGESIKGRVMLQMHQYQEHYKNPELANLKVGNKHPCPVCLKLFTRNRDVKYHISRVHIGDRKFPCNICGKKFKVKMKNKINLFRGNYLVISNFSGKYTQNCPHALPHR